MHNFVRIKQPGKKLRTPQGKFITVAMSFAAFIAVFVFLYPWFGLPIIAVGIIPLLIGAWFYGVWAGIMFTLALYVIDLLIIMLLGWGNIQMAVHPGALLGLATGVMASLIVGRLGEINRRNQEEFRQRMLLLEERNDRSRFLTLLNDISLGATETDNMSSMLEVLAERIGNLFSTDNCYITFWEEKQHKVTPMAAYSSLSEAFFTNVRRLLPNDLTLTAVALDAGHTVAIEDIKHSRQFPQDIADGYPSHSVLGLPLIAGDRKLGAVILGYNDYHHFAKEEIEYGELAAHQISLAVTKALLLEEARQRLHELAGLHNISQTFSLRGDPRQTFGLLTKTLAGLMNVKICFISLYNPVTQKLRPQTLAYGLDDKLVASIHYSSGTQINILEDSNFGTFRANSEAEIPAEYLPLARSMGVDCILIAPLLDAEKHLLGAIFAANKPGGFADDDVRLLEVFVNQVTAVVKNACLLNAERTRAEQLAVLHAIAVAITQVDNEDQLIENVTLIIGQKLYSDSFGILLLDETSHELHLHSSYRIGPHEGLTRVPLGVGVTGAVAKSGKPRRVNYASVSPEYLSLSPSTRSELCVPLKVAEKLLGVVNVESTKAGAFTIEDEKLLTIIAGQLATAIQRLRTVRAERYQTQQLERSNSLIRALAQVNARAAAASDPDGVLQTLGSELAKLGLRCAVALSDANNQFAILRYLCLPKRLVRALERIGNIKLQDYAIPITKLSPHSDLTQHSFLVKDPLSTVINWAPDFPRHTAVKILKLIGITETTSVCHLPLITEGKPMGILWMWGEALKESDLNTVSLFASQVAAALQNSSLLTEVGRLAITDDLTGIFNRRHFFEMAEERFAHAQKNGSPLSALIVDLDHFKQFNDCYGHGVGDQVLHEVARLMSTAMRESDIIGRYGGEEFSILLPDTTVKAAIYVAERLLSFVSDVPIETEAGKLTVQLSVGVAGTSKETPTLHSLILRADQAMYLAKSAGRNCVAVK
jgi:diguanylate cyclase (GGDEF)-like protein